MQTALNLTFCTQQTGYNECASTWMSKYLESFRLCFQFMLRIAIQSWNDMLDFLISQNVQLSSTSDFGNLLYTIQSILSIWKTCGYLLESFYITWIKRYVSWPVVGSKLHVKTRWDLLSYPEPHFQLLTNVGQWFKIDDVAASAGRKRRPPHRREIVQASFYTPPPFHDISWQMLLSHQSPAITPNYQSVSNWGGKYPRMIWNKLSKSFPSLRTSIL
jgi:hypothetical protein